MILAVVGLLVSCEKKSGQEIRKLEIGRSAPDFLLNDIRGRGWNLSDLRGKVVLVNFWATWCPPCREKLPDLQALYEGLPREKFEILAILNNDDPRLAEALAAKIGLTFPILTDPGSKVATSFGLTGVPETFIIDPDGILRGKILGPRSWNSPKVRKMLEQYLP